MNNFTPEFYKNIPEQELFDRITKIKKTMGDSLLILGHHYQRDEVIQFADKSGDSFALAKDAADATAKSIVFCGVHFMAETADVITNDNQNVYIPDPTAGCFLADCANIDQVEKVWKEIKKSTKDTIIPLTYINSSVDLKSFTGKHGGIVCTSSNAQKAMKWAMNRGEKLFFFPDQHLGRNSAVKMGIPLEKIIMWDYEKPNGGHSKETINSSKLILWNGYCDVHQEFDAKIIDNLRIKYPEIKIIAHAECSFEVCQKSDYIGSTKEIISRIQNSPVGSIWGVGTEKHLVNRLKNRFTDKKILFIQTYEPECKTMAQITPAHLLFQLENISNNNHINRIIVDKEKSDDALKAINRMLKL